MFNIVILTYSRLYLFHILFPLCMVLHCSMEGLTETAMMNLRVTQSSGGGGAMNRGVAGGGASGGVGVISSVGGPPGVVPGGKIYLFFKFLKNYNRYFKFRYLLLMCSFKDEGKIYFWEFV